MDKILSIIWNVTYKCPWKCKFCIMDAGSCGAPNKKELSLKEKLQICRNIDIPNVKVDLSGGEVMCDKKHLILIDELSNKLGKDSVGISTSGFRINMKTAKFLSKRVHDVEMTMDAVPGVHYEYREDAYHETAGNAAKNLKKAGIYTGLQTVLTREHMEHQELLVGLRDFMVENKNDEWSLIRYFPSGRGEHFKDLAMTDEENLYLVNKIKDICEGTDINLDIHYLLPGSPKDYQCRCVKKSIGILPDGNVTACFWGLDDSGSIKDSKFYLGNLLDQPLSEILESENAVYWKKYCGGCPRLTEVADEKSY